MEIIEKIKKKLKSDIKKSTCKENQKTECTTEYTQKTECTI